jgi:methylthioribose-1-phosphate isomerase
MLTAAGIPCTVVLDSAVAYVMDKVDFVLVGSEAVVESGGLINATGSNQIPIIAKYANKPFYALAERFVISSDSHDGFAILQRQFQIPSSLPTFAVRPPDSRARDTAFPASDSTSDIRNERTIIKR